ncbi:MAG: hypothetical protein ACOYOQ_01390 [Microthrixaceae bacterium]
MRPPLGRALGAVVLAAIVLLVGGCRLSADVLVRVDPDGSGEVTVTLDLDREAAERLGPADQLDVEDLELRGWRVDAPVIGDDGLTVVARRPFAAPEELAPLLEDITGPDGPLGDVQLRVESSQLGTEYQLAGALTSTGDPAVVSDPELTALLGGLPLGRTPEELAAVGADRPDAATLTLRVVLPGADEAQWSVPLTGGQPASVVVDESSNVLSTTRIVGLLAVVGLLVAAVVVALRSRR